MSDKQGKSMINGQIRHLMTAVGGMLATRGFIAESEVEVIASIVIIALGLGWSIYEKMKG